MNIRVLGVQQRIDNLESRASVEPVSADAEIQSQIARFLCVLSSGLIEQALIHILSAYAQRASNPAIERFVSSRLSKIRNAKFEDILTLLGSFNPEWREHFELTTAPEVKEAIDSLVNNRNQIAHGQQTGISLAAFREYYRSLKRFISDLDQFVNSQ